MAKGFQENKDRKEAIGSFGKSIGKRAAFKCEWCESKDELRVWDYQPDLPRNMDMLALLFQRCREWADGRKADPQELRSIRNALWSNIPATGSLPAGQSLSYFTS